MPGIIQIPEKEQNQLHLLSSSTARKEPHFVQRDFLEGMEQKGSLLHSQHTRDSTDEEVNSWEQFFILKLIILQQ